MAHSIELRRNLRQRGSSLLECLISILLVTVGLLGNATLQAGLSNVGSKAGYRIVATNLAKQLHSQMTMDYQNLGCYSYPINQACTAAQDAADLTAWVATVKSSTKGLIGASDPVVLVNTATGACTITLTWTLPQDPTHVNTYTMPFLVDTTI